MGWEHGVGAGTGGLRYPFVACMIDGLVSLAKHTLKDHISHNLTIPQCTMVCE